MLDTNQTLTGYSAGIGIIETRDKNGICTYSLQKRDGSYVTKPNSTERLEFANRNDALQHSYACRL